MNESDLRKLFPNASASTIRRNSGVDRLPPEIAKPKTRALEQSSIGHEKRTNSVVKCHAYLRITFIRFCTREFDDDNLAGAYKQLRDVIAAWTGCDDSKRNIEWEYAQVLTRGKTGTAVKIERIL